MKGYLGSVFLFGWLFDLATKIITLGSIKSINQISGAAGVGLLFLTIATLIVRPWKRRVPGVDKPPPFRAASITIGFFAFFILVDVFRS